MRKKEDRYDFRALAAIAKCACKHARLARCFTRIKAASAHVWNPRHGKHSYLISFHAFVWKRERLLFL